MISHHPPTYTVTVWREKYFIRRELQVTFSHSPLPPFPQIYRPKS